MYHNKELIALFFLYSDEKDRVILINIFKYADLL